MSLHTSKSEVPTARSETEHCREMNVNGDDTSTSGDAEGSENTPLLGNVSEDPENPAAECQLVGF